MSINSISPIDGRYSTKTSEMNTREDNKSIPVKKNLAPQTNPTTTTNIADKPENANNAKILPVKSLQGLIGIDIIFFSNPLSLS